MDELAKCPFCGKDTVYIEQTGRLEMTLRCSAGCINYKQKTIHQTVEWLRERMIADWNTRPIESALRARIEELTIPDEICVTAIIALHLMAEDYSPKEVPLRALDWLTAHKEAQGSAPDAKGGE
jgi:hypothetical protein